MTIRNLLIVVFICLIFSACATVEPLKIPNIAEPANNFEKIEIGEVKATFALSKIVKDIDRGKKVMAFPNFGSYKGDGAYCNYRGAAEFTYIGGRRMLGNWSTELGEDFYEVLTNFGYSIAGDPSDIFNQQNSVNSAEYLIGGRLVDLMGNYCHKHHWWDGRPLHTYSGETYIKIEWSILNTLTKEVIFTKTTEGYGLQEEPIVDGVYSSFSQAFVNATEKFAVNDKLRAIAVGDTINVNDEVDKQNELIKIAQGDKSNSFSIDAVKPYVVTVRIGRGHGSGLIIGKNGYVLTNAHVVGKARTVQIVTSLGLEIEGKVLFATKSRDVALIKTLLKIQTPIFINKNLPVISKEVFAVGSPIKEKLSLTVTKGITSAIRKDKASGNLFIQGDVAISPGSSGGPLFDSSGNVIGLSVGGYTGNNVSDLNLFIPIKEVFNHLNIELVDH
jgi:serine protease Do